VEIGSVHHFLEVLSVVNQSRVEQTLEVRSRWRPYLHDLIDED
jgi:hypothetical protein